MGVLVLAAQQTPKSERPNSVNRSPERLKLHAFLLVERIFGTEKLKGELCAPQVSSDDSSKQDHRAQGSNLFQQMLVMLRPRELLRKRQA